MRNGNNVTTYDENEEQDTINSPYLQSNYNLNRKSFLYLLSNTCLFSVHFMLSHHYGSQFLRNYQMIRNTNIICRPL